MPFVNAPLHLLFLTIMINSPLVYGCKTMPVGGGQSNLHTDETLEVLSDLCDMFEPEGELQEILTETCTCLESREGVRADVVAQYCSRSSGVQKYMASLKNTLVRESESSFQDNTASAVDDESQACAESLTEHYLEISANKHLQICNDRRVPASELNSLFSLPDQVAANHCWALTRMNAEACIIAEPCKGSGPSDPQVLPLDGSSQQHASNLGMVPEGESVAICHSNMRKIHKLKDADNVNMNYSLSFANLLAFGRSFKHVTYAPANCHGTAQALIGGVLGEFPVSSINYHSAEVKNQCQAIAEQEFARAQSNANSEAPPARSINVSRGGYLINMDHKNNCDASNFGEISYSIFSCQQEELVGSIFFEGMCVDAWGKNLQKHGLAELLPSDSWRSLKAGCVLTSADHSIAMLYENNGLCYYYESTTPYGPPRLRVEACNTLYSGFPRRWCPEKSLRFTLAATQR